MAPSPSIVLLMVDSYGRIFSLSCNKECNNELLFFPCQISNGLFERKQCGACRMDNYSTMISKSAWDIFLESVHQN